MGRLAYELMLGVHANNYWARYRPFASKSCMTEVFPTKVNVNDGVVWWWPAKRPTRATAVSLDLPWYAQP